MKRQVLSRLGMLGLVSMFILLGAVTSANAQLSAPVRAKIPFDFNLGEKKLPAGEYTFSRVSAFSNNTMAVSSANGNAHAFLSTFFAEVITPRDKSTLIFHRYGDQYFLEQIWTAGELTGTQVPQSRSERELRMSASANDRKRNLMDGETVEVVASLF